VRYLGPSFGGINLEDIKAPDCFIIESRLRELMDIPVFHDDQHGTAIIAAAGLINALHLTGRDMKTTKLVCNGAGSAGIACIELIKAMGFAPENVILCDTKGVVYQGREEGMNQWKSAHAVKTDKRSLADAMNGADVVFGLSAKGAFTEDMVRSMAPNPIIFAMANPDPEVTPEEVARIRDDAIVATGRSDYPNQVNNVLGFPYIFRGALDVRATTINDAMKIAAVNALAELAREDVPDDVVAAYQGSRPRFGPNYIIPVPFDPRLLASVSAAVAKAAMETGVAGRAIADIEGYKRELSARRDPIASTLRGIYERVRRQPKRIVFAEGEEEQVMRAAVSYVNQGLGTAILVGREERVRDLEGCRSRSRPSRHRNHQCAPVEPQCGLRRLSLREIAAQSYLTRDCHRLINNDRNHFAACMVALGDADGMVTGVTRNYATGLDDVRRVIDSKPGHRVVGVSIALCRGRTVFIADTAVHEMPTAAELADIAVEAAGMARRMGYVPRVAAHRLLDLRSYGGERSARIQEAVRILCNAPCGFRIRRRNECRCGSEPEADGTISVHPPVGSGERDRHTRQSFGVDCRRHAAGTGWRDDHRSPARRPRQALRRSSPSARRIPTSSIWRQSPPITRRTERAATRDKRPGKPGLCFWIFMSCKSGYRILRRLQSCSRTQNPHERTRP
jgi:malate dehydrogenase (oxaloacetate-decarboxylating)(NADP+)